MTLAVREPFAAAELFGFLAARAVAGVEEASRSAYRRTLTLPRGPALVELEPAADRVACRLRLSDMRDLASAIERCRRLLDLDADPVAIDAVLATDELLRGSVTAHPGMRLPGHVDGFEVAVRAVVGQQISVAGARTILARLVAEHGEPFNAGGDLCRLFPSAQSIAAVDPDTLPMPRTRARALVGLAAAVASGEVVLDRSADRAQVRQRLLALAGIGPWTADYIAMRALGDPDTFLATDRGVRQGLATLGLSPSLLAGVPARADRWRPWRSYALMHVWAALNDPAVQHTTDDRRAISGSDR